MPLPPLLQGLALPVIGAPMFIVSGPELVIAQRRSGIVGAMPSLNARPANVLSEWLTRIAAAPGAPYAVNLIVHPSNIRLDEDLAVCVAHKVPLIITSLTAPGLVVEKVHAYGGLVFHDVTNLRHARKALDAGVDGLIAVCAGAGGHGGTLSPFALIPEIRAIFDGPLVAAGAIGTGGGILAAQALGADLAYIGTRFIATDEAAAAPAYKQMVVEASAADIVYTPKFSGVPGNYLRASIGAAGLDPDNLLNEHGELSVAGKAWRDIWSAGQGVGATSGVTSVDTVVGALMDEYIAARR